MFTLAEGAAAAAKLKAVRGGNGADYASANAAAKIPEDCKAVSGGELRVGVKG